MRSTKQRRLAGLLLALAATGGLTACGSASDSGSAADMRGERPAAAPEAASTGSYGTSGGSGGSGGSDKAATGEKPQQAAQVGQPGVDRKLVRTATIVLVTPDVRDSAERARAIVVATGGYTGQADVGSRSATMTLYVPSDKLDDTLGKLSAPELGKEESRSQAAEDVTEQIVDVESRIQTQRASLERVRALLGRAQQISEIVQLESEVTRREADLESLLKRRERLAGSVAMSTVTLRLSRDSAPAPVADDDTLLGALAGGWKAFVDTTSFVVRAVALVLPFAVVLGVPAYLLWRRWRRSARPAQAQPVAQEPVTQES
ncbi:protein of unknown function [Actinokineospora alba]|uniref:DUF4349 domain-containing protein n=1 Tax=Actinokineospora alba TaxID=504798 RepID=A0A1H0PB58_9PSEU|nr:DUF4349 domain-containing protein [Actinokineospora alba]TDP65707.1 uncharacterized protein DUF4349 [Actinokineospora alba]SDI66964.1 protein of unknown function [Actinokineospora alba]SDP01935.1 protein of unknown function [Actinokineospora alba]